MRRGYGTVLLNLYFTQWVGEGGGDMKPPLEVKIFPLISHCMKLFLAKIQNIYLIQCLYRSWEPGKVIAFEINI